jgi:ATP/maltotriose-dependent transcriptional regulator MalT
LYAVAALWGPTPTDEAVERCRQILADASGDRRTEGLITSVLARLVAMAGDTELGLRLSDEGRAILHETGRTTAACSTSLDSAGVAHLAGRPELAEQDLRRDYQALEELGERFLLPTVAAELARTLYIEGSDAEADRFATLAQRMAPEDDVATQALWRSVRACVLARSGSPAEGAQLAREAVDLLAGTDSLISQADAELALAEVLHAAGRRTEATEAAGRAAELVERKGDVITAARARSMASSFEEGSPAAA